MEITKEIQVCSTPFIIGPDYAHCSETYFLSGDFEAIEWTGSGGIKITNTDHSTWASVEVTGLHPSGGIRAILPNGQNIVKVVHTNSISGLNTISTPEASYGITSLPSGSTVGSWDFGPGICPDESIINGATAHVRIISELCSINTFIKAIVYHSDDCQQPVHKDLVILRFLTSYFPEIGCPLPDRTGYNVLLPNLDDCRGYFECINGVPIEMWCPYGLHFNDMLKVCDWPVNANCFECPDEQQSLQTTTKSGIQLTLADTWALSPAVLQALAQNDPRALALIQMQPSVQTMAPARAPAQAPSVLQTPAPIQMVEEPAENLEIILHPNPVENILTIESNHTKQPMIIIVYNSAGHIVFQTKSQLLPFELNVERFATGTYVIRIFDQKVQRLASEKFIKM
jgi:hypothetical protein